MVYELLESGICLDCLSEPCRCKRKEAQARMKDRHPDAVTNDWIYARGEFDVFYKSGKTDVELDARRFNEEVSRQRKMAGLE